MIGALLVAAGLVAFMVTGVAGADFPRGERVFQRCYACHSVKTGETNLPGPNLAGVIGRRAGTIPGFRYSPAMRQAGRAGLVWNASTLDRFLADPEGVVPGSEMSMPGLADPQDRRDVIDYLAHGGRAL